ncbi:hypothetical protein BH23GEM1_BH23GEM1_03320 [soil metagenome]
MTKRAKLTVAGFLGGAAIGTVLSSMLQHNYRRELFSGRPFRRYMALTYLRTRGDVETARLLREYVGWESNPTLKKRAQRILRRVEGRVA